MKGLEKKFEFDEKLPDYYPIVKFNGELVKYNPNKHQLEKGESATYLDFEEQKIKEGIIEAVDNSDPMNLPVYTINGKPHMYHRVWPKVENNKANLSAQDNQMIKSEGPNSSKEKSYDMKLLDLARTIR
jgi:hypothetical protein